VSFWTIDRFGRKPLYIVGSLGMGVVLFALAIVAMTGHFTGITVLILILAYVACFSSCIGPVFWTLVPEIFPNRVRSEAMIVPVMVQWIANAIVVLLFPSAMSYLGRGATFLFLGVMALAQCLFAWRFVPETKGKTLEEIESMWDNHVAGS
jgi:MFS family permease